MALIEVSGKDPVRFASNLTIVFIALKLMEVIDWSWWLVLSPIGAPIVALVVFLVGATAIELLADLMADRRRRAALRRGRTTQ